MRRLVVFRRPALRNGGGPVAIQRLRRRRALLVYLQRAGLLPALPRQRNKGHPRPALGKRSSEAARNAGLHRWRDLRPPILQEHQLGATRAKRYRTAVQTQSPPYPRRSIFRFGLHHRKTSVDSSRQRHPRLYGSSTISRL